MIYKNMQITKMVYSSTLYFKNMQWRERMQIKQDHGM